MKIRNGFVSNSSSSSFVIVVGKDDHKKALQELPDFPKKVMESLNFTSQGFRGEEVLVLNQTFSSEDGIWGFEDIPEEYDEIGVEGIIELYANELDKNKVDYIFDTESC